MWLTASRAKLHYTYTVLHTVDPWLLRLARAPLLRVSVR